MQNSKHLNVLALGVALGITWALGIFLLGLMAWYFAWGIEVVAILSSMYIGYAPTLWGIFTGAFWAFLDCFIAGVMIAWIYNRMC